jgi:F-box interacting protein
MPKTLKLSSLERVLDDLVYDILTWLPVKSLLRFRCVSKTWYSTIISPLFSTTHHNLNEAKSYSSDTQILIYWLAPDDHKHLTFNEELCTVVSNGDHILTEISKYKIHHLHADIINFSHGMFCFATASNEHLSDNTIYLCNPSIKKLKKVVAPPTDFHVSLFYGSFALGLGYHSQNNDFRILRIVCYNCIGGEEVPWAEAKVYTLSTDSWKRVVISLDSVPNIGPIVELKGSRCLFFNGALHSIVYSRHHHFILSFDLNDERFREIMLPSNYKGNLVAVDESLVLFKRCLAFLVFGYDVDEHCYARHIWVMKEYGVAESWTKISVPREELACFLGCTYNGELLIEKYSDSRIVSFDLESLNKKILRIPPPVGIIYTANFVESLALL